MRLGAYWFFSICLAQTPVKAEIPCDPGLSETEFFEEVPVVLSATRLAQTKDEAPAPITVITREMIRNSGARDIATLLRLVPGMLVGQATGVLIAASQHGLTSSLSHRMQIMVDGRSIYNPLFGGVGWANLPVAIEDIERIEVVRGPNAASYGSSALLGVINILTRHAAEDIGTRASLRIGTNSIRDGFLGYSSQTGALNWRLSLNYHQDHGTSDLLDNSMLKAASLRGDYQWDTRDSLLFEAGLGNSPREIGSLFDAVPPADQQADIYFGQLRWEHVKRDGNTFWWQLYVNAYVNDSDLQYTFFGLPGPPVDTENADSRSQRTDMEIEDTHTLGDQVRLVWGAGLRMDNLQSELLFNTDDTVDIYSRRLFGNLEWRPSPRASLNLGGMLEDQDLAGTKFSPRLGLNYHPRQNHTLRLGVSRATRNPMAYEEQSSMEFQTDTTSGTVVNQAYLSSGGLDAETITSFEAGYLGHWVNGRLDLDARVFHDHLSHLIGRIPVPAPADFNKFYFDYIGNDEASVIGAELQLDLRLSARHFYRLSYAYTNIHADDTSQPFSDSAPKNMATLFGVFPLPHGLSASATYSFVGRHTYLTDFDANLGGVPLDPIHRLDLRLSHPFRAGGQDNEVALVVQSALGDYQEFQSGDEFQRRVWLEVSMNLR